MDERRQDRRSGARTHAWPTLNNAIISIVDDDKVDGILNQLHEKDLKTPDLGLRAFSWGIEKMI